MADDKEKGRLEKRFADVGRSVDDYLRVRDLIEYDNEHHGSGAAPAAPAEGNGSAKRRGKKTAASTGG